MAIALATLAPLAVNAQAVFKDINTSVAADIVSPQALDSSSNKTMVRSAEALFYAPIDYKFDGFVNIAGHDENGEFAFELHEAYIESSKLIPNSRFRVGKFFINVGRLNTFHQHDWPFTMAPKSHREFFNPGREAIGAEGAADTGIEYTWLLPTESFIDLTVGVTNNYCFGHCHEDVGKPLRPMYYFHPTTFLNFSSTKGMLIGASYLNRIDSDKTETSLYGIDLTFKNRQAKVLRFLVQAELFYQHQKALLTEATKKIGGYVHAQYGYDSHWDFGLRFDGFSHLNMKFVSDKSDREDFDYAITPIINYSSSEFAKFRLSYSYEVDTTQGVDDTKDRQIQLQAIFFLGAHPAHTF
jgi:hypothetical protein